MADTIKEDDDKEELVVVEDKSLLSNVDEQDDDNDDDDSGDARIAAEKDTDRNDDEREAIRERRRQEKLERKHRREEAIKRDKVELDFLRKRNDDLERRLTAQEQRAHQIDLGAFDSEIAKASQEVEMAERVIAKAVEAGNGADVAQAMRYRDQAMARAQQLQFQKQQASQYRPQPKSIDDATMHFAQEFMKENPWYDAQGRDEESSVVMAIDQTLAREGFDPRTEDYWQELRRRAAKRLPERFSGDAPTKGADARREPRGGPAVGSGREHAPASTRREFYISPERKQALIDAGVWDDPVLRGKYIKRYAEYDRRSRD